MKVMLRHVTSLGWLAGWLAPLVLFLSACSDAPKTASEKEPPKPPEALTGREAFQRMYPQARGWAPDAQPLEIVSLNLVQVKAEKGKAGAWQVVFVSASRGKAKTYTYSAVEDGNLHEGVFGGIRIRIAALPECFDELLALFVGGKMKERTALFR